MKVYVLIELSPGAEAICDDREAILGIFGSVDAAKRSYLKYQYRHEGDWYSPDPSIWRLKTQSGPRGQHVARIEEHEVQE